MQKLIFLLGFMGCGKSYWGAKLAQQLGIPFVDLDERITAAEGLSVSEIFTQKGENTFRQLERQFLIATALHDPCVIATGGGTPCFFENMDWMNANGTTVYLKTPVEILAARLKQEARNRPLLQDVPEYSLQQHIEKLLINREPFYLQAQHIADYTPNAAVFLKNLLVLTA